MFRNNIYQNLCFMTRSMTAFVVICVIHNYMTMYTIYIHHLCHVVIDINIIISASTCDFNDYGQV
jgi:hypothetical protein